MARFSGPRAWGWAAFDGSAVLGAQARLGLAGSLLGFVGGGLETGAQRFAAAFKELPR
jgi:hypothetical protein